MREGQNQRRAIRRRGQGVRNVQLESAGGSQEAAGFSSGEEEESRVSDASGETRLWNKALSIDAMGEC